MDPHERRLVGDDRPLDERHVLLAVCLAPVHVHLELAEFRREGRRDDALDELLPLHAELDEVLDGDDLQPQRCRERQKFRHPSHRPVLVHDLADDAGGPEAGEPAEIDDRFGMTRAAQHPALHGAERKHMSGACEVARLRLLVDEGADGGRTVERRDPRLRPVDVIDRDGERRFVERGVAVDHQVERQLLRPLRRERRADDPPSLARHEIDRRRGAFLGGDREIALVLAILVVDDDDHLAVADVRDGFVDPVEPWRAHALLLVAMAQEVFPAFSRTTVAMADFSSFTLTFSATWTRTVLSSSPITTPWTPPTVMILSPFWTLSRSCVRSFCFFCWGRR